MSGCACMGCQPVDRRRLDHADGNARQHQPHRYYDRGTAGRLCQRIGVIILVLTFHSLFFVNSMTAPFIAFLTAIFYASALVSARRGMKYSTPVTVTCVSVIVQTVTLWTAVFLTGGIPRASPTAVWLFAIVGVTQLGVRLLAYTGVHKIGASRSSSLQAISPLISAGIAIVVLHEEAGAAIPAEISGL